MSTRKTGFMYDSVFSQYKAADGYLCLTKEDNPWIEENDYYDTPERVQQAYTLLEKSGLLQKLVPVRATPAPIEELQSFHTPEYIEKLRTLSEEEGGKAGPFCRIGKNGLDVIRTAVGGDMAALDAIMKGELDNAFCLQRPPSAHAERSQGFGFCVVNDYNILINYARRKYGLQRIMLVDFDNHYKLGIEQAWYDSDAVLYAETHQTGVMTENSPADRNADFIGEGQGKGYNVIIPLPTGSGDAAYIKAFEEIVSPIADQYKPELVVVIAGFAANLFDPLGGQQLTAQGYGRLAEIIRGIAERNCNGRLIAMLEGGKGNYMAFCIQRVIEALSGATTDVTDPVDGLITRRELAPDQERAIQNVKSILAAYWKL